MTVTLNFCELYALWYILWMCCWESHPEFLPRSQLMEVNELAFSLIYAQATIWLMNPGIDATNKHTLSRALAVEFVSVFIVPHSQQRIRVPFGPSNNSHLISKSTFPKCIRLSQGIETFDFLGL